MLDFASFALRYTSTSEAASDKLHSPQTNLAYRCSNTFCNSLRKSYINIIFLNAHHMPVIGLIIEGESIAPPGILTLGL